MAWVLAARNSRLVAFVPLARRGQLQYRILHQLQSDRPIFARELFIFSKAVDIQCEIKAFARLPADQRSSAGRIFPPMRAFQARGGANRLISGRILRGNRRTDAARRSNRRDPRSLKTCGLRRICLLRRSVACRPRVALGAFDQAARGVYRAEKVRQLREFPGLRESREQLRVPFQVGVSQSSPGSAPGKIQHRIVAAQFD